MIPFLQKKFRLSTGLGCAIVFAAALVPCFFLSLAYPFGFLYPDSNGYLEVIYNLKSGSRTLSDAYRTPGYGVLLWASLFFKDPSSFLFWIHSLLFSACISLVCWLCSILFRSVTKGIIFALLFLILEVVLMRTFFLQTSLLSDALYCYLLFGGALLMCIGWLKQRSSLLITASLLLGVATFIRPIPSVFVVWIPFLFFAFRPLRLQWKPLILCLCLLVAPIFSWSMRNVLAYHTAQPMALTGPHLMYRTISLIVNDDRIFNDPQTNADFHEMLRTKKLKPDRLTKDPFGNATQSEWGAINGFFASLTPLFKEYGAHVPESLRSKYSFQTNTFMQSAAYRVIRLHYKRYFLIIASDYWQYFQISKKGLWTGGTASLYQKNPAESYTTSLGWPVSAEMSERIYKTNGKPDLSRINHTSALGLWLLCCSAVPVMFIKLFDDLLPYAAHAIAIIAIGWIALRRSKQQTGAIVLLMLFLNAAIYYAVMTAAIGIDDRRFALPGSLSLDLLIVLSIAFCLEYCLRLLPAALRQYINPAPAASLCLSLSGRAWMWPLTRAFLERQTYPHAKIHLIILDTSHNPQFAEEVRLWLNACDYGTKTYVQEKIGSPGLADRPRMEVQKEVCAACTQIYNHFTHYAHTPVVFFLEDDVLPPDHAYVRLQSLLRADNASVSAHYVGRGPQNTLSIEWDWIPGDIIQYTEANRPRGVQPIGGNGFGCVAVRGSLLQKTTFRSGPDWQNYDYNFYDDLRKEGRTALIDWDLRCRHYTSLTVWS